MAEALAAVGRPGKEPPGTPTVEGPGGTLVLLALLGEDGASRWSGLLLTPSGGQVVGDVPSAASIAGRTELAAPARALVDLVVGASISYAERFEELGRQLDALGAVGDHPSAEELATLQRGVLAAHRQLARLERLLAELSGPLGSRFPGVADRVPFLSAEVGRTAGVAGGILQAIRDLAVLRTALEANRLARSANELGRVSDEIAALANTSNVRMLGVAYVALVLALVSVVVLIPNTAATILGMPSAAWVPGLYVDAILVVLAVVPLVVVFSRPWVRRMLAGSRSYVAKSAEGLADLPEVAPEQAARPASAERLIRQRP